MSQSGNYFIVCLSLLDYHYYYIIIQQQCIVPLYDWEKKCEKKSLESDKTLMSCLKFGLFILSGKKEKREWVSALVFLSSVCTKRGLFCVVIMEIRQQNM